MSEHEHTDDIFDGIGTYPVVLLVEQAMSELDARQVLSLHEQIVDQVTYHLLLPVDDAAARVEASLGTLGAGDLLSAPAMGVSEIDIESVRQECRLEAERALAASIVAITEAGGHAEGWTITDAPVDALAEQVEELDAREAIVLTRPHLVAQFFGVDWASRARRKLGVPVLHLIEHETFDEQAGGPDGVTGL